MTAPTPRLPRAPAALQPVLERLMAKRPEDRYESADALLADLEERALVQTVTSPKA
jgi:hypothetical protein